MIFVNEPVYTYTMHDNHVSASMAMINAERLVHDMEVFQAKTTEFFQASQEDAVKGMEIQKGIGHALMHYLIIFLVRSCWRVSSQNRENLQREIGKIVESAIIKDCLRYYSPSKGNSRVLPWLMRLKWIHFILWVSRHKAFKRYGRPGGASR
jgi:hypothetical protein